MSSALWFINHVDRYHDYILFHINSYWLLLINNLTLCLDFRCICTLIPKICYSTECTARDCVGLRLNYETYPFYLASCYGLQGAVAQYAANQTKNTEQTLSLFDKVHWVLLRALHNTLDQRLYVPSEGQSNSYVSC